MSLRHLSKLKQQQEIGGEPHEEEEEDDDDEEEDLGASRSTFHQLLDSSSEEEEDDSDDDDDDEEEGDEEEDDDDEGKAPAAAAIVGEGEGEEKEGGAREEASRAASDQTATQRTAATTTTTTTTTTTQAKHRKGGRGGGSSSHGDGDDDDGLFGEEDEEGKVDVTTRSQGGGTESSTEPPPAGASWLCLDAKRLNVENEIKSRFGAMMAGEAAVNRSRRGLAPRQHRGGHAALAQLYLRKCMLGPPKEEWSRSPTFVSGGLRLARIEPPEDCTDPQERSCDWYRYEHSVAYRQLQRDFELVQSTHDPNALAVFLAHNPYHVDGLLTLAMLFAHTGQLERATEYVRRCLFVLESAYCESYRPADPSSSSLSRYRMDIRHGENRPYFMAMFRHIQMVAARGLYKTGLEVAKLLLSLDPSGDPTGILLAMDYLAIRAQRPDLLLTMVHDSGLTIGRFKKEKDQEGEGSDDADDDDGAGEGKKEGDGEAPAVVGIGALPNMCYSCALAHLHGGKRRDAVQSLRSALRRFPVVLPLLVSRCRNDLGSKVTQPWESVVLRHSFFSGASSRLPHPHGRVLSHLANIYVVRSCDLWKTEQALDLLFETCVETLRDLDAKGLPWFEEEERELCTNYASGSPVHKYLAASPADFMDEFESLPGDMNPLDPALMDPAIARRGRLRILQPGVQQRWQQQRAMMMMQGRGAAGGGGGHQNLLNPDLPLMELFWRTLLPWNAIDHRRARW